MKRISALLATLEGVKRAARDWEANGRAEAWLAHQGQRLAEAQGLDARADIAAKLDPGEREYLASCGAREADTTAEKERAQANALALARAEAEQARARARGARTLTGVFFVAALALAGVGGWAWLQRDEALTQKQNAERAAKEASDERTIAEAAALEARAQKTKAESAAAEALKQKSSAEAATADAKAQRDRAEKTLGAAIKTANTLVLDMAKKLRNVSGMPIKIVQGILYPALELQDGLIASGEANPELRLSEAMALNEAVTTRLVLGDTKGALENALKSRFIMLELVRQQPGNSRWRQTLAISHLVIGDAQTKKGNLTEALEVEALGVERGQQCVSVRAEPGAHR